MFPRQTTPLVFIGLLLAVFAIRAQQANFDELLRGLPAMERHGPFGGEAQTDHSKAEQYDALVREKLSGSWFAALVPNSTPASYAIVQRFNSWNGFMDFLQEQDALVELWNYVGAPNGAPRRIPATAKNEATEQPTFVTVTYRKPGSGIVVTNRVEFGLNAAKTALGANQSYLRQRQIQRKAHEVLSARNDEGQLTLQAQWESLSVAVLNGELPIMAFPSQPAPSNSLFVAFEYELDAFRNFQRIVQVYSETDLQHRVVHDRAGAAAQILVLKKTLDQRPKEAWGYRRLAAGGALVPAPNPIQGQDDVELRVRTPAEPDVEKWNVIDFGEPELIRQSALARFSLISAHLERQRKQVALRRSNLDLIAEPIFLGLNVGGGVTGVPFPIGEAARLGYNAAIVPQFIPPVPTVKQLRQLLLLLAARERHPEIKLKPQRFLSDRDLKTLQETAGQISERELRDFVDRINDDDLNAMLALARLQHNDAEVSNFLSIFAGAARVGGITESGLMRNIFNSPYFSVTGDVSLSTIIAVAAGGKIATPLSGVSLESLSQGRGRGVAWLQYLNLTVDLRAVMNTAHRLVNTSLADKELKKPFPYAPRLSDLAAYELRIFGYPLLIWYKRGLLKNDIAAFDNDYAYGLLGATIVEHFKTRQEMDAEIRAGAMVPLGYVLIPDKKLGWRESNLAVFAHVIRSGKYKGKTSIIIYGLKAYHENSELIERQYRRFKEFERSFVEGGVIERTINAENRDATEPEAFEPKLHVGSRAIDQLYAPLFGLLQEWRRVLQRRSLAIQTTPEEEGRITEIKDQLAAHGIRATDPAFGDPLVASDRHGSTFIYRKYEDGRWQLVQLSSLPGLAELQRELTKAEDAARIETARREALSQGDPVVLIHAANQVGGSYEVGPLLRDEAAQLVGVRAGLNAVQQIFSLIDQLPVIDRVRLALNNYASTLLDLDLDSTGRTQKVFLTIEFPPAGTSVRLATNAVTGELQKFRFEYGTLKESVTTKRILELDRNEHNEETASRLFENLGGIDNPKRGPLLEETKTLEVWLRASNDGSLDPYQSTIRKLRLNHITGEVRRETYGLFEMPVESVSEQNLTITRYDAFGHPDSAEVFENGKVAVEFERPLREKILRPVQGNPRFRIKAPVTGAATLPNGNRTISLEQNDLITGITKTIILDPANGGRKIRERFTDTFDGSQSFEIEAEYSYRADFFHGLVPAATVLRNPLTGVELSRTRTMSFDPLTKRLLAEETDYTGGTLLKTWDSRWEDAIEIETALRRTTNYFDRQGLSFRSVTVGKQSAEVIAASAGRFDSAQHHWLITRDIFYRPGITNRSEIETRSSSGKLIASRLKNQFEVRPIYDQNGIAQTNQVSVRDPASGRYDLIQRLETDFRWRDGVREARITTYVDGKAHTIFSAINDSEGRTVTNSMRRVAGLDLHTSLNYDRDSERVVESREYQNGNVRTTRLPQPEQQDAAGRVVLPVAVIPFWGLAATQTFLLGDPLARPEGTQYENGRSVRIAEWFTGTAIPLRTETLDRQGNVIERTVTSVGSPSTDRLSFDRVARYKIGRSGLSALISEETLISGTDIVLFNDSGANRVYFDLRKSYNCPRYVVDLSQQDGMTVLVDGTNCHNVLTLLAHAIVEPGTKTNYQYAHSVISEQSVDLRSLFFHEVTEQVQDRAGNTLDERIGHVPFTGRNADREETLLEQPANSIRSFHYQYDPGWIVEQANATNGGRVWAFSLNLPPPDSRAFRVNDGLWREFATEVQGVRAQSEAAPDLRSLPNYPFRRIHSRREIERNPYMPGSTNVWTTWTATELAPGGQALYDSEMIYDSRGNLCVTRASKTTSAGLPAFKLAYNLDGIHAALVWRDIGFSNQSSASLNFADGTLATDLSGSDFIYWGLTGASNFTLSIRDGSGHRVEAGASPSDFAHGVVQFSGLNHALPLWLPDSTLPRQGITIDGDRSFPRDQLLAISTHDLARAGLNVHRIGWLELKQKGQRELRVAASPIYQLVRGAPWLAQHQNPERGWSLESHSSGLTTLTEAERDRTARQIYAGQGMKATIEYNRVPVAITYARFKNWDFPFLVVLDHSDSDAPRPLYAISPKDGHFLEHYKTLKLGDAQVYSVVRGFDLPHLDVFRAGILEDELGPGYVAYGDDYQVSLEYARGGSTLGKAAAMFQNRVAANGFRYAGQHLLEHLPSNTAVERLSHFNYESLHDARAQAREINRLPMLAESLLPSRPLPWDAIDLPDSIELQNAWKSLRFRLGKLHLEFPTLLIPTAPETEVERYVETSREADLVVLALKLSELALVRDILEFYWEKSQGGQQPLHSFYDARSGTAMRADVMFKRPVHAPPTAVAQLAMADAAFQVGLETNDPKWLTFGRNLLETVLKSFRPPEAGGGQPRGIAELKSIPVRRSSGLTFWPEADTYSLQSNARAYLLLKQLNGILPRFRDQQWRGQISDALKEQERWLRWFVLPEIERTGVAPKGLFQMQDIHRETTALAVERSTSAEDWLFFLQAAQAMDVPPPTLRLWLENLARLHGVRLGDLWGLDWNIAVLRPDVISPEITAQFWRTARLLEHKPAEAFANRALKSFQISTNFPAAIGQMAGVLSTGQGSTLYASTNRLSPAPSLTIFRHLRAPPGWDLARTAAQLETNPVNSIWEPPRTDTTFFIMVAGTFYLSILVVALFWWRFRALRRAEHAKIVPEFLVPAPVMQLAEERWAARVLGLQTPASSEHTRFSNAPVEQNFLMQLRAIYKLVLEWRRQENGWAEDDRRVVDHQTDDWINGADEFVTLIGLYMRWVIKAGTKDGFHRQDVMLENEDSNHIWSRLVMYLGEYYWGLLSLQRSYNNFVTAQDKAALNPDISRLLSSMGLRQRAEPFDARRLFNFPADPAAMDLLLIQKPGMTLDTLASEMSLRLRTPYLHIVHIIERYKLFKRRERPYPVHPYALELAKVMPHFLLMGLGALVWYNRGIDDSPIMPYLWSVIAKAATTPAAMFWTIPLFFGLLASGLASLVRVYRFDAPMLAREKASLILDATLTSLFAKRHSTMPKLRRGRWWNPRIYEYTAWALRAVGFLILAVALFRLDTPSFATFLVVKGILAMLALAEVAAVVLPLAFTWFSKAAQDYVSSHPGAWGFLRWLNKLNITAVRPASPLALSFRYHFQPSVPSGTFASMAQCVLFYFVLAAVFFAVGAYLCQQIFSLWFTDRYLNASDWKLFFGGLLFWNTMYLLRYGLFVLFTGIASALVTFPLRAGIALVAFVYITISVFSPGIGEKLTASRSLTYGVILFGLAAILLEDRIRRWFNKRNERNQIVEARLATARPHSDGPQPGSALGIVYMSGDDLSHLKLTPDLLMDRWTLLRDKLNSSSIGLLQMISSVPDDQTLREWFQELYEAEKRAQCTLWLRAQIVVRGGLGGSAPIGDDNSRPAFRAELGLNIEADSEAQRDRWLVAWHLRRWLVSMMSTAGHSQDTAINLVDMALRLQTEGLGKSAVFYLIQNKYDNGEHNRPSQLDYLHGELAHRNKLARLLTEIAPGARAYNLQNWTPFGFKAGGLMAMDLAHEETLQLGTLVLLDRNATVHDLDAFTHDLRRALADPELIIIVPGRSTTNTLTSIGQASQMVEEGHRSFLKGLMGMLGGTASESVGTGWGNIITATYGRVQGAMLDAHSLKMPLTSRMWRGSSFAVRTEGLIGFAPHAVGISEDSWAVSQAAHNTIGMGRRVKYGVSKAIWHKIRETWSHSEWLASFPRWSGGYLQMMQDPIMQRINDLGPKSIFAKEVRANSGRFFLMAPFALLNILVMPLAIMLDITPFVQILLVLWNFGFVMNQVLTIHALNTFLESSGFHAIPAILSAGATSLFCLSKPGMQSLAPALILLSALAGGFIVGLGRWLYTRVRDLLLFGPQLVLHALGQLYRQSLEFVVSGASPEDAKSVNMAFRTWVGPREDRPLDRFGSSMNLKTVIWVFGLASLVLNLVALLNLDLLNVLLLLPSLVFTVSILAGPFLLKPRVGHSLRLLAFIPRLLGWICSIGIYMTISLWLPHRGKLHWAGLALLSSVIVLLFHSGLRYAVFRRRLLRRGASLTRLLIEAGLLAKNARELATELIGVAGSDLLKAEPLLTKSGIDSTQQAKIIQFLEEQVRPVLRRPVLDVRSGRFANSRWFSEFNRSFVLSLLVLMWLFVVPVPGLFVFTAGDYRVSIGLWRTMALIFVIIALGVLGSWAGSFIQWIDRSGMRQRSLTQRIRRAFANFQQRARSPGALSPEEISSTFALFTDIQTYMDQRSYGYARKLLVAVESKLHRGRGSAVPGDFRR